MRYAGLVENDVVNGEGVSVSLFMQGCPHHCLGCHNPESWSFTQGIEISYEDLEQKVINAISANGIQRNFSVLGGEPLCPENITNTKKIMETIKAIYPTIKIYVWSGYTLKELKEMYDIKDILKNVDVLIEGRFELDKRDITLKLRGSSNQRILYKGLDF